MQRTSNAVVLTLALAIVLTACAPQATPTPTPQPTATRVPLATPTLTATAVPVRPTSYPTPVPSLSPEPTGVPIPCTERICLTASPVPVSAEGRVTLQWNAPGAVKVDIRWQDTQRETVVHADLAPAGSLSLSVAEAYVQTIGAYVSVWLNAYYDQGEVESWSESLDIPVRTRHSIRFFTVSPQTADPGETVTLNWDVAGQVEDVSVYTISELGQLDAYYCDLAASGSLTVTVPESRRNHMSFQLYAEDPDGLWLVADASVAITCPDVWFFPNPPSACPRPATYTKMAVERFERGMMIWTEWEDRIRVFFDDSTNVHLRSWSMYDNAWFEGMPESDPGIVPPPGLHQPVCGFGQLWREGSYRATPIRELLGWAVESEWAIGRGAVQCEAVAKYATCYIGDPQGTVYVEQPEGSGWYAWAGPDAIP